MIARAAVSLLLLATTAHAESAAVIELAVGATVERAVGPRRGLVCDDPAIVRADVVARTADSNALVVTGLAPGTTLCRVGTEPHRSGLVFELRVRAAPTRTR